MKTLSFWLAAFLIYLCYPYIAYNVYKKDGSAGGVVVGFVGACILAAAICVEVFGFGQDLKHYIAAMLMLIYAALSLLCYKFMIT